MNLYPKNDQPFDEALFRNPTEEYRGAPFWSWNTKLKKSRLKEQIAVYEVAVADYLLQAFRQIFVLKARQIYVVELFHYQTFCFVYVWKETAISLFEVKVVEYV